MLTEATTAHALELERYPGIPAFALDLVHGKGTAAALLNESGGTRFEPIERAPIAEGLRRTNREWGNGVDAAIDRWERGAAVLIAGQQVGLGGGPLYTLTKIASLIRLRERCRRDGIDAVAMFWLATEDHDYLEVANLLVATHNQRVEVRPHERPDPAQQVGSLPLPESARLRLLELFPDLPATWLEPGICFGDSFARLLAIALKGRDVILIDSMLPELRRAGAPLYGKLLEQWPQAEDAVAERSVQIAEAGYRAQIVSDEGHALLWLVTDDGRRLPVRRRDDGFLIDDEPVTPDALRMRVEAQPDRVSTGALTRPLLQDIVFSPHTFIGGPAEVSYYAQCVGLHRLLGVAVPRIMLRGHVLVAPARIIDRYARHGFALAELFEDPELVLARHAGEEVTGWQREIDGAAATLLDAITAAVSRVENAPPQLTATVERSQTRIGYHLQRLQQRGSRAIARRDLDRANAFDRARQTLAPEGVPQDRVAGWLPWYALYGDRLIDALIEHGEPGSTRFAIAAIATGAGEDTDEH